MDPPRAWSGEAVVPAPAASVCLRREGNLAFEGLARERGPPSFRTGRLRGPCAAAARVRPVLLFRRRLEPGADLAGAGVVEVVQRRAARPAQGQALDQRGESP